MLTWICKHEWYLHVSLDCFLQEAEALRKAQELAKQEEEEEAEEIRQEQEQQEQEKKKQEKKQ